MSEYAILTREAIEAILRIYIEKCNNKNLEFGFTTVEIVEGVRDKLSLVGETMYGFAVDCSKEDTIAIKSDKQIQLYNDCEGLFAYTPFKSIDFNGVDISGVTNMSEMFCGCENLTSLKIGRFDTRNVTDMSCMFSGCKSLESLDLSGLNTSNLVNTEQMFYGCSNLQTLELGDFNTSKVRYMNEMFKGCSKLKEINASRKWKIKKDCFTVNMFKDCAVNAVNIK